MYDFQIELIHQLFSEADRIDLPLWLQGGWAIDAKLNRITHKHMYSNPRFSVRMLCPSKGKKCLTEQY